MTFIIRKRKKGELEFGIIYGIIALLAIASAKFLPLAHILPKCFFREFTGIPCPTCGATRSLIHLSHGDFWGTLLMNPLFAFVVVGVLVVFFVNVVALIFRLPRLHVILQPVETNILRAAIAFLFILNWIYLVYAL